MPGGPIRDRPRGNRTYAVIFLVTVLLIVSLYVWNKQKIDAANREEMGRERLCEVRAEMGLDPGECEDEQVP
ncbi:MAG TPA: hypothetical protein VM754_04105 [Actinomycetota bacterium]|nr:hypothetical protein [Actinomycetota bacterium]